MPDRPRSPRRRPRLTGRSPYLGSAALALTLAVLPVLAGCDSGTEEKKSAASEPSVVAPGKPGEQAETLSPKDAAKSAGGDTKPNSADFGYATKMIEHHQQAVVLTDIAEDHASAKGVRKLASRVGAAQQPEIEAMQGWLESNGVKVSDKGEAKKKGGDKDGDRDSDGDKGQDGDGGGGHAGHGGAHGSHTGMPGMATEADLDKLRAARGKGFDALFLKLMTAHHRGAITMATQLMEEGNDVRIEEMATDVMAQQTAEIKRMRKLG